MGKTVPGPAAPRTTGEIVRREIAGETILVPVRGRVADMRRIFALNTTAAFIWERIDGSRTAAAILEDLVTAFDVPRETASADLDEFLARAAAEGLLAGKR